VSAPPLIVIFGAAVRSDGSASSALLRRIGYGFEAARAHPDAPVLCSGGVGRTGPSEASVMVAMLARRGLAERLIADEASLDTLQSVAVAARLARGRGSAYVIACSDSYHLPRIRLMLAVLGVRSVAGPQGAVVRGDRLHRFGMALREIPAIPYDVALVAAQRRRLLS